MSNDDLIRRGDAMGLQPYDHDGDMAGPFGRHVFVLIPDIAAIPAAIPAVTPDGYARGFAAGIEAAAPEPVVRVKPLVWEKSQYWKMFSSGPYSVQCEYDREGVSSWVMGISGKHVGDFPSSDAAKAAAQADYEARILSAFDYVSEADIRSDERAKVIAEAVRQTAFMPENIPRSPRDAVHVAEKGGDA